MATFKKLKINTSAAAYRAAAAGGPRFTPGWLRPRWPELLFYFIFIF